jgi:hypothetical protein
MVQSEQLPPQNSKTQLFPFVGGVLKCFVREEKKSLESKNDLEKEAQWSIKFWSFKISLSYMFKKPNNSILTLRQVEFLVNLKLNW